MVAQGVATALPEADYTVQVDITGLAPGAVYYYGFAAGNDDAVSALGRTRTAPVGAVERMRVAMMSCSSIWSGYFNAYRRVSERDVDLRLRGRERARPPPSSI